MAVLKRLAVIAAGGLLTALVAVCGRSPSAPTPPISPSETPAPPAAADTADAILGRCPTPSEVSVIDGDLTLIFDQDPTGGQVVCTASQSARDLTLLQAQVYRLLTIMRKLSFDAPLAWTSKPLYEWLTSSIRGIRFRTDIPRSFCCDPPGTIDVHVGTDSAAIQFPSDFGWAGTTLVLFVHEARHNNGLPHTCGTNDNTIGELGAWGVQYYLDLFLGSHSDPSFISASARSAFLHEAIRVCSTRFCQDHCP